MENRLESLESRRLLSATISGVIYQDIGAVGSLQPGDPGLAGWTVYLDLNHNDQPDAGEPSTVTDASGRYTFSNVAAGTYDVRENPVTGFKPIPDAFQTVTVIDGQTLPNVDIGNQKLVDFTYPGLTAAQDSVANYDGATTPTNAPNSSIAVSTKYLVTVNNNSITTYRREDGTELTTQSLSYFFGLAQTPDPTFPNAANVTDAEVFYSPGVGRFFVAAIDNVAATPTTSAASYIVLASSQKINPNEYVWHYHYIDVQATNSQLVAAYESADTAAVFASHLSLSFNGGAVYIASNINDASGNFAGSRLWIVNRGRAFGPTKNLLLPTVKQSTKYLFLYDPSYEANVGYELSNIDAANFSGKSISNVNVDYLVAVSSSAGDYADVIRVRRPGASEDNGNSSNKAVFSNAAFAIPTTPSSSSAPPAISSTAPPPAIQPDSAPSIDTTADAISATWRRTYFWVADTLVPSTGPDAGTAQVYWFQYNLPNYNLLDYGSVSGSAISAGASTFDPSIGIDRDQYMALSFTASGPSLDPGIYAVSRRTPDPLYYVRPALTIAAGQSTYSATTESSGLVDWGLNQMVLDPASQERFWILAHYPTDPSSTSGPWAQTIVGFELPPKIFPVLNS